MRLITSNIPICFTRCLYSPTLRIMQCYNTGKENYIRKVLLGGMKYSSLLYNQKCFRSHTVKYGYTSFPFQTFAEPQKILGGTLGFRGTQVENLGKVVYL